MLRLNRKSSSPVGCKLIPWPVSALTHQHFSAGCTANNISIQQELAALRRLIDNAAIDELGTSNSSLSATALEKDAEEESSLSGPQNTVFLVAFDSTSMLIWGSKHQMLHDVLNWALRHKQALFVLPVNGHEVDYHLGVVNEHMAFAQAALSKQT